MYEATFQGKKIRLPNVDYKSFLSKFDIRRATDTEEGSKIKGKCTLCVKHYNRKLGDIDHCYRCPLSKFEGSGETPLGCTTLVRLFCDHYGLLKDYGGYKKLLPIEIGFLSVSWLERDDAEAVDCVNHMHWFLETFFEEVKHG